MRFYAISRPNCRQKTSRSAYAVHATLFFRRLSENQTSSSRPRFSASYAESPIRSDSNRIEIRFESSRIGSCQCTVIFNRTQ